MKDRGPLAVRSPEEMSMILFPSRHSSPEWVPIFSFSPTATCTVLLGIAGLRIIILDAKRVCWSFWSFKGSRDPLIACCRGTALERDILRCRNAIEC